MQRTPLGKGTAWTAIMPELPTTVNVPFCGEELPVAKIPTYLKCLGKNLLEQQGAEVADGKLVSADLLRVIRSGSQLKLLALTWDVIDDVWVDLRVNSELSYGPAQTAGNSHARAKVLILK